MVTVNGPKYVFSIIKKIEVVWQPTAYIQKSNVSGILLSQQLSGGPVNPAC